MRKTSGILIITVLCVLLTGTTRAVDTPAPKPPDTAGIQWKSYDEGMALGKDQKKKVFLNFYADWCQYCKLMDGSTFKDKSVIAYLNENFVTVRVNSDKERKIAAQYGVTGLPVSWFVAENGEHIGSQPGYVPPDTLLVLLKYIRTDSYKTMNFTEFMEKKKN